MTPPLLQGIGVSPGLAVGPAMVLRRAMPAVPHRVVPTDQVETEVARLHEAVDVVRGGLEHLRARTAERVGPEEAGIFDAQILMLQDEDFLQGVERLIRDNQLAAARAFEFRALEVRAMWANSASQTLRERVADLTGMQLRVLEHLLGQPMDEPIGAEGRPAIVCVRELTPGLTVEFDRERVMGFVSEDGTRTSHAAILARSLGIPCVMGVPGLLHVVTPGATLLMDGETGSVVVEPDAGMVAEATGREDRRHALRRELEQALGEPSITADGVAVTLRANLDLPEELDLIAGGRAEGVGLFRTEFLLLGRTELPREEEQLAAFRRVLDRLGDVPLVVRSYDAGGDKFPAAFRIGPEPNPFLGWRAIRVCLDRPEMFMPQLRALLRARGEGDVRLMLPLVTDVHEVLATRDLLAEAMDALEREGLPYGADLPVGVMVETPAAAVLAAELAAVSDFLSVGTNDLTQYTLAVDRSNARLAPRFSAFHPAVLRLLRDVLAAGRAAGVPVAVCGELASEPMGAALLLGLGYRELSVSPSGLPAARWLVRHLQVTDAEAASSAALLASSAEDVMRVLRGAVGRSVDLDLLTRR